MEDENLAVNISFVADAIIKDIDNPYPETWEAALALTLFSWNNEIQKGLVKKDFYRKKLNHLEKNKPTFWKQLIRDNPEELLEILTKRKAFFFGDDKRLLKECFLNVFETISAIENNEEETLHVEPRF